jgi:hypothetical protein
MRRAREPGQRGITTSDCDGTQRVRNKAKEKAGLGWGGAERVGGERAGKMEGGGNTKPGAEKI